MSVRFLPDTSVLVPTMLDWHPHHVAANNHLQRRLTNREEMVLSVHSLAEAYSAVTRLPGRFRVQPTIAWHLIAENFLRNGVVAGLSIAGYVRLLGSAPSRGITGGRVYDALIAETAREARVDVLLTFNERHFRRLVPGIEVVIPTAP